MRELFARRTARASTPRLIRLHTRARSELYERLGVTKRSSDADIKKAYRKLSLKVSSLGGGRTNRIEALRCHKIATGASEKNAPSKNY